MDNIDSSLFYFDNLFIRNRIRIVNRSKKATGKKWSSKLDLTNFLFKCLNIYFPQHLTIWCESFNFTHVSLLCLVQQALECGFFKMEEMQSLLNSIYAAYKSLEKLRMAWELKFESEQMNYILFLQEKKLEGDFYTSTRQRDYDSEYFGHVSSQTEYADKVLWIQKNISKSIQDHTMIH